MSEKPGKRLVSKKEYVRSIMTRAYLLVVFAFFTFMGLAVVFPQVVSLRLHSEPDVVALCTTAFTVCFAGGLFLLAFFLFVGERKVERVALIPKHTTNQLPEAETLVRPSDLPPSGQQAELLRAVGTPSSETAPEELLRATTGSRISLNEGEGRE